MNQLQASDASLAGQASHIPADNGEPKPPAQLDIPAAIHLTRDQLVQLRAGAASLSATITIKRAATGVEETYNLTLTPIQEA